MSHTVHLFLTPKLGAPMEDLGQVRVSPKPVPSGLVYFTYKGRQAVGIVALIDPSNWEKRPGITPKVHVFLDQDGRPPDEAPPKRC